MRPLSAHCWILVFGLLVFAPRGLVAADDPAPAAKAAATPAADPSLTSFSLDEVRAFDSGSAVSSVAFTPDGHTLLIGGDTSEQSIQLWDTQTGKTTRKFDDAAGLVVACAPDQPRAAVVNTGTAAILYNLADGKQIREFPHNAVLSALAFSPDGRRLATAGTDQAICVWEVETGKELIRLRGHEGGVTDVAFTPSGRQIVSASEDKTVRVWDATTGSQLRSIAHPARVWRVAVSPDGKQILSGTGGPMIGARTQMDVVKIKDNAVFQWDLETGDLLHKMKGHTHAVLALAFHPTLPLAVSGGIGKVLLLWDLQTGKEICRVQHGGWVAAAAFSPDGKTLISGGGAHKRDLKWVKYRAQRIRQFNVVAASPGAKPKLIDAKAKEDEDETKDTVRVRAFPVE